MRWIFLASLLLCPAAQGGEFERQRKAMIQDQLISRGIADAAVLEAMANVPREEFVPEAEQAHAHEDNPLPIGYGQTISQPYVVAFMTEALQTKPGDRVLEVGTGSGYQAAVLARLVKEVYSIEIVEELARRATETLARLGCDNVRVRGGDGYRGWPEAAPFDAIVVTCAPDHVPQPLVDQLADGGRMVIPVGSKGQVQELVILQKHGSSLSRVGTMPVRFVPMTGEAEGK